MMDSKKPESLVAQRALMNYRTQRRADYIHKLPSRSIIQSVKGRIPVPPSIGSANQKILDAWARENGYSDEWVLETGFKDLHDLIGFPPAPYPTNTWRRRQKWMLEVMDHCYSPEELMQYARIMVLIHFGIDTEWRIRERARREQRVSANT